LVTHELDDARPRAQASLDAVLHAFVVLPQPLDGVQRLLAEGARPQPDTIAAAIRRNQQPLLAAMLDALHQEDAVALLRDAEVAAALRDAAEADWYDLLVWADYRYALMLELDDDMADAATGRVAAYLRRMKRLLLEHMDEVSQLDGLAGLPSVDGDLRHACVCLLPACVCTLSWRPSDD
jgi:hypothetical protein